MRAALMAGATKDEFDDWDRTSTRPIDEVFGAGELNVANSYRIIDAGEHNGSVGVPTTTADLFGYGFVEADNFANAMNYQFDVATGMVMDELSVFLNWNVQVQDDLLVDGFNPTVDLSRGGDLANYSLSLFDEMDLLIDHSISPIDNFEHIYVTDLAAGSYRLEVSLAAGDTAVDYGLAWRSSVSAVPEPGSWIALATITMGWRFRRRRFWGRTR